MRFLTTRNIESAIEDLLKRAQRRLVFITPFLQIHPLIMERIHDAAARGVAIVIVCRGTDVKPAELAGLSGVDGIEIRFMENLHAKCYLDESRIILTSMNLYDASRKNREMGVEILASSDPVFIDAMNEVESILANATPHVPTKPKTKPKTARKTSKKSAAKKSVPVASKTTKRQRSAPNPASGYCIRCKATIPFDTARPFCKSCFAKWRAAGSPTQAEVHCHECATTSAKIAFDRPRCYTCWKK